MRLLRFLFLAVLFRSAEAQPAPAQSLWASLGAGGSGKGPVLTASALYSRGSAVVIGRRDIAGGSFGRPSVDSEAILVGGRTVNDSPFALAAVGIARARFTEHRSEARATRHPPRAALAFQIQARPGHDITPLGIAIVGVAGPGATSYVGAVLTLDLGWFRL